MKREVQITVAISDIESGETLGVAYSRARVPDDLLKGRLGADRAQDWYLETIKITGTAAYRDAFDTRIVVLKSDGQGGLTAEALPPE